MKTLRMTTLANFIRATVLLCAAGAATAGQLVDMEILGRGYQRTLPTFYSGSERFVEARQNQEFRVRLHNRSGERVLAVLSVDGVNAITGQTAGTEQKGYVLNPYQSVDVDGWRKSERQTSAFYFTHIGDSYAARTGRPANVGVIGVAVFREQNNYPYFDENSRYESDRYPQGEYNRSQPYYGKSEQESAASEESKRYGGIAPEASSPTAPGAPLGTGHGRREYNPSYSVTFQREAYAFEVEQIRYDSRVNLIALGVIPSYQRPHYGAPEAFPRGYVPDPPRYSTW